MFQYELGRLWAVGDPLKAVAGVLAGLWPWRRPERDLLGMPPVSGTWLRHHEQESAKRSDRWGAG